MIMKIRKLFFFLFCTLMFASAPGLQQTLFAQVDSSSVHQLLKERDREIKELLGPEETEYTQQQREQLKDIINGIIDYRAMAKTALAETYDTLSVDQRNEFVDLFSTIIRDQSLNRLEI